MDILRDFFNYILNPTTAEDWFNLIVICMGYGALLAYLMVAFISILVVRKMLPTLTKSIYFRPEYLDDLVRIPKFKFARVALRAVLQAGYFTESVVKPSGYRFHMPSLCQNIKFWTSSWDEDRDGEPLLISNKYHEF